MKTTSAHKLLLLTRAFKKGETARIIVAGVPGEFEVKAMNNLKHTMEFKLNRGSGFLVVDMDDVVAVRFFTLPEKPAPDDDTPFEVHVD